jgi:hypothetical protein
MEKRIKLMIFITGLYNKPQGCGASVASAAGPFTTQKKLFILLYWYTQIVCGVLIQAAFNASVMGHIVLPFLCPYVIMPTFYLTITLFNTRIMLGRNMRKYLYGISTDEAIIYVIFKLFR